MATAEYSDVGTFLHSAVLQCVIYGLTNCPDLLDTFAKAVIVTPLI